MRSVKCRMQATQCRTMTILGTHSTCTRPLYVFPRSVQSGHTALTVLFHTYAGQYRSNEHIMLLACVDATRIWPRQLLEDHPTFIASAHSSLATQ